MPHASSLTMEESSLNATVKLPTIELCDLHQLSVILEQSGSYTNEKRDVAVFGIHMTLEVQFQMQASSTDRWDLGK
jgi:hypothetical protein